MGARHLREWSAEIRILTTLWFSPFRRRRACATGRAGLRNPWHLELLHREKANKVFGKRSARLLAVFTTGRPSSSAAGGYRRRLLHGLLHRVAYSIRDVHDTVIANIVPSTESALAADRNFATALKHKRTKISVQELIASLDVEQKAWAKDTKGGEGHSVANTVQNQRNQGKGKGKFKPNKTTNFKKKKNKAELPCFMCGELGHFFKDRPEHADRRGKRGGNGQSSKTVNTVTACKTGDAGYGNLPTVLSVIQSFDWWIDTGANVHVIRDCSVLMGNGSAASILGTGTVDLKFTSGKIVQLKNVQHVPSMNKNLVSGSLLLRDGFKVVLESNKVVVSRHGLFIGKGYVSGGLFRLSLLDFSNKCVNHICGGVNDDASLWHCRLCHNELDSILSNGTWELTERSYGCKPVGCKWLFKKKLRPDGTIEKYKARLVAKGYTQKEGEDFFDTYSPVARMTTIRVLLSLAVSYGLIIHQMDVKTAFLNGELEEEIYMEQPKGFVVKGQESKTKQWHEKFDTTLTSAGFAVNEPDSCVYYRYGEGKGIILCLYVDDILIFGTDIDVINEVKSFLSTNVITLSQTHYVEKVLSRFGYIDSKPSPTPYDPSVTLKKNKRIGVNQLKYSQIIGSLMYLGSATRPDTSFAVHVQPGYRSLACTLKGYVLFERNDEYGIHYSGHPAVLEGYSDANWISDDELYATSGYVFMLGGGAVSWRSCKQTILTRSTMEAELAALDTTPVEQISYVSS
ncbi:hypothetical protein U9M48_033720 [Paspalum notatum var. saurae]|uniref:Uncharacterized protein n=1 Tax=Paspalum notatum var. saurae TaxID=547442 RepID=A0AAQ3U7Y6_PASNO